MMEQVYEFDRYNPPVLNERRLRMIAEKKRLCRQTIAIAAASFLTELCLAMCAVWMLSVDKRISMLIAGYLVVSLTGEVVISLVFTYLRQTKRFELSQSDC